MDTESLGLFFRENLAKNNNGLRYLPLVCDDIEYYRQKLDFTQKSREWLIDALRQCLTKPMTRRTAAFVISEELTRRDIPPCFRQLPHHDEQDLELSYDLLTYDLQWLNVKYPNHVTGKKRLIMLFKQQCEITSAAIGLFWNGRRERWLINQELALTDEQQFECHWIRSGKIATIREKIFNRKPKYRNYFERQYYEGQQCGMSDENKKLGIKRRLDIWQCAEMVGRTKPTEIAKWYYRKTGQSINRATVSVQLKKIPQRL